MKKEFGIVKNYDGLAGVIVSGEEKILFLKQDVIGEIKNDDEVFYRKEEKEGIQRAFFIQKNLKEEMGTPRKMVINK